MKEEIITDCDEESRSIDSFVEQYSLEKHFNNIHGLANIISSSILSPAEYVNKIPYIMHHVWFTHQDNPRELRSMDIDNIIATKKIFNSNFTNWTHIVWTNNKDLIPSSVETLENNGIEVRSIKDNLENISLLEPITYWLDKKLWGVASDAFRYSIMEKFGGIYSDLNFKFFRSIEIDLHKYDFIFQGSNSFFAAKNNHPIVKQTIDMIEKDFKITPEYLSIIDDSNIMGKTIMSTLIPFIAAFLEYNNNDTIDIMFSTYDYNNDNQKLEVECVDDQKFLALSSRFNISGVENLIVGIDNHDYLNDDGLLWMQDSDISSIF